MAESIFEKSLKSREMDQETKKAIVGLKSKKQPERIDLSLPADAKKKFLKFCVANGTTASRQLRDWIKEFC